MNILDGLVTDFRKKLRVLEREIGIEMKSETTCCGITLAQCHILLELLESGPLTVSGIAEIMRLDKSTLSRTIDGLVEKGLVLRNTEKLDRRSARIELSKSGIEKIKYINNFCNGKYSEFLNYIPEKKLDSVIEAMGLISEGLKKMREKAGDKNCYS